VFDFTKTTRYNESNKRKQEKSIRSVLQKAPPRGFRKKKDAFRANKGVWQINSFFLFALFAKMI